MGGLLQGKRHQQNLAKRAAREAAEKPMMPMAVKRVQPKKTGNISPSSIIPDDPFLCM